MCGWNPLRRYGSQSLFCCRGKMEEQPQQTKIEEVKEICRKSLWYLCTAILGYSDWDALHDDIEKFIRRPSRRKLILVPRGHLKTAIVTKAYSIQTLLRNPNARVLIANQVWDKAREMLYEIKEYLTTKSILPKIFGSFESNRWTQDEIVIAQRTKALSAASISTTGVEAEMTSAHFDLIIMDDLQGLMNYQTPEQREKVKRFYRSMIDLLEPEGQLIAVGTRWHLDDIYQHIMDNESAYYDITVRKVIENGKLIFPKKFQKKFNSVTNVFEPCAEPCMDFIDYLKRSKGSEFYAQYMNDPIDLENQLFPKDRFRYWLKRPDGLFVTITIDLAISFRESADYTALIVGGMDKNHNIYILDYIQGRWRPSDIVDIVFQMREKWNPTVVGMEVNGFQKTMQYSVEEEMRKRNKYFPITEINNTSLRKEYRIKALEPFYRNNTESVRDSGKIYHAEWMKEKDLEQQLMAFSVEANKAKHDDLIDAESMLLNLLVPGQPAKEEPIKPGTWAYIERQAHLANQPYKGFFNYGN
jgi:predicted phage terminase large subunit-like protein